MESSEARGGVALLYLQSTSRSVEQIEHEVLLEVRTIERPGPVERAGRSADVACAKHEERAPVTGEGRQRGSRIAATVHLGIERPLQGVGIVRRREAPRHRHHGNGRQGVGHPRHGGGHCARIVHPAHPGKPRSQEQVDLAALADVLRKGLHHLPSPLYPRVAIATRIPQHRRQGHDRGRNLALRQEAGYRSVDRLFGPRDDLHVPETPDLLDRARALQHGHEALVGGAIVV